MPAEREEAGLEDVESGAAPQAQPTTGETQTGRIPPILRSAAFCGAATLAGTSAIAIDYWAATLVCKAACGATAPTSVPMVIAGGAIAAGVISPCCEPAFEFNDSTNVAIFYFLAASYAFVHEFGAIAGALMAGGSTSDVITTCFISAFGGVLVPSSVTLAGGICATFTDCFIEVSGTLFACVMTRQADGTAEEGVRLVQMPSDASYGTPEDRRAAVQAAADHHGSLPPARVEQALVNQGLTEEASGFQRAYRHMISKLCPAASSAPSHGTPRPPARMGMGA